MNDNLPVVMPVGYHVREFSENQLHEVMTICIGLWDYHWIEQWWWMVIDMNVMLHRMTMRPKNGKLMLVKG